MAVLQQKQKDQLKDLLGSLPHEVKVHFFTQEMECQYCKLSREMIDEVVELSDKIQLEVHDFVADAEVAKQMGVDKIPALVLEGEKDYGIRFFGVPAGYEFTTLVEDIIAVGMRNHGLPAEVLDQLKEVDKPVDLQVFISPTCPYCPKAVRAAHRLAMASDQISAAMVETGEFPFLVQKYDVHGVPHTMITDDYGFIGQIPPEDLLTEILIALGKKPPEESVFFGMHEEHEHEHEHQHEHEHHHEHDHEAAPPPEKKGKAKPGASKKPAKKPGKKRGK